MLLGARTLLGAPGIATRSKSLIVVLFALQSVEADDVSTPPMGTDAGEADGIAV